MADDLRRDVLPIPDRQHVGVNHLRREGSVHLVSTDHTTSSARRRAERADRADRRHWIRGVQCVRGAMQYANLRASCCRRPQIHALPHDCLLLPNAGGSALGPQSPLRRHGRHYGDRHISPGYSSVRPKDKAPLAETLKLNGYATAQFGKCHEVPVWETSPMGPFDRWPSPGNGFEHFYGFIGGETNQYAPAIYRDTVPVEPDRTPEEGYHFTEDMTDHAIDWVLPAEGADARQALLRLLRAGCNPCPSSRPG